MDDNTSPVSHQRKQSRNGRKIRKPCRKEIKVVYISNPMKVSATASEFRDLVQRLTGQDAADLPDPSKFAADDQDVALSTVDADADEEIQMKVDAASFDDVFTSQMLESLFMPTANAGLCSFESAHLDMLRSLDAV